jgi:hypothetical protein
MPTTNPWAIDFNQFKAATDPYLKDGNFWSDENGKLDSGPQLQLANGKTWRPSGWQSGITYHPKGEVTYETSFDGNGGEGGNQVSTPKTNEEDYWEVRGDLSEMTGQAGSEKHVGIKYKKEGDKLVPIEDPLFRDFQTKYGTQNRGLLMFLAAAAGGAGLLEAGAGAAANGGFTAAEIAANAGASAMTSEAFIPMANAFTGIEGIEAFGSSPTLTSSINELTAQQFGGAFTTPTYTPGMVVGEALPNSLAAFTDAEMAMNAGASAMSDLGASELVNAGASAMVDGSAVANAASTAETVGNAGNMAQQAFRTQELTHAATGTLSASGGALTSTTEGLYNIITNGIRNATSYVTNLLGVKDTGLVSDLKSVLGYGGAAGAGTSLFDYLMKGLQGGANNEAALEKQRLDNQGRIDVANINATNNLDILKLKDQQTQDANKRFSASVSGLNYGLINSAPKPLTRNDGTRVFSGNGLINRG